MSSKVVKGLNVPMENYTEIYFSHLLLSFLVEKGRREMQFPRWNERETYLLFKYAI